MTAAKRQHRHTHRQGITGRRVAAADPGVEHDVGEPHPREVALFRPSRCEDDPAAIDTARVRSAPQILGREIAGMELPQDRAWNLGENAHPGREDLRLDLVGLVEQGGDEAGRGQTQLGA